MYSKTNINKNLIIPIFDEFTDKIKDIYNETIEHSDGNNTDYIPQLRCPSSPLHPEQYGISICTMNGQRFNFGVFVT